MESYSLYQLNEYVRRVIALNFREPLWIEAEISQINESRGNHYIELVEKNEEQGDVIAQISAALWYRQYQFVKRKLGDILNDILVEGSLVRLKCKIDYHERYGLKLIIEDVDPSYTFGQLELRRQAILKKLDEGGLMELNKGLVIPAVIQKIAVISSASAAGYQDFTNQLVNNNYGYTFKIDLYDGAVQGVNVASDTINSIDQINNANIPYDVVTIIRGGGSKLDLSGFDNYEIAEGIALSKTPFLIGIGHDVDTSVVDLVASQSLKTPTAVADFIIDHNMNFEAMIDQLTSSIQRAATNILRQHELDLVNLKEQLKQSVSHQLQSSKTDLMMRREHLTSAAVTLIQDHYHHLEKMALMIDARDPQFILSQGYSMITKNNKLVDTYKNLSQGDRILIQLKDGSVPGQII